MTILVPLLAALLGVQRTPFTLTSCMRPTHVVSFSRIDRIVGAWVATTCARSGEPVETMQDVATRMGRMLLTECIASVRHRHPDGKVVPEDFAAGYVYVARTCDQRALTEALTEYQDCASWRPGWPTSDAKAIVDDLGRQQRRRVR